MLLSLRIVIAAIVLFQGPLFYCALSYGSPVENALTAYGEGRSWLYHLGRPSFTLLSVLFGFFSDLHYSFRYFCFVSLLVAIVMDSLSEAQVSDRWHCLLDGRCPQRGYWSATLLALYVARDLVALALESWALFITCYLMTYIGFYRPYYSYRQLTVGEFNRILKLQEQYALYFEDLYQKYFAEDKPEDFYAERRGSVRALLGKWKSGRAGSTNRRSSATVGHVSNKGGDVAISVEGGDWWEQDNSKHSSMGKEEEKGHGGGAEEGGGAFTKEIKSV